MKLNLDTVSKLLLIGMCILLTLNLVLYVLTLQFIFISQFLILFYSLIFMAVLTSAQFQVKKTLQYFHLLNFNIGKGLFALVIGFIMLNNGSPFLLVCSIVTLVLGLYFIILSCIFKGEHPTIETNKQANAETQEKS